MQWNDVKEISPIIGDWIILIPSKSVDREWDFIKHPLIGHACAHNQADCAGTRGFFFKYWIPLSILPDEPSTRWI